MTPYEVAEKIASRYFEFDKYPTIYSHLCNEIEAAIKKRENKAAWNGFGNGVSYGLYEEAAEEARIIKDMTAIYGPRSYGSEIEE